MFYVSSIKIIVIGHDVFGIFDLGEAGKWVSMKICSIENTESHTQQTTQKHRNYFIRSCVITYSSFHLLWIFLWSIKSKCKIVKYIYGEEENLNRVYLVFKGATMKSGELLFWLCWLMSDFWRDLQKWWNSKTKNW